MSIPRRHPIRSSLSAGLLAGIVGGIPSTVYALLTGGDALEAVDAVAAMVGAAHLPAFSRLLIGGGVHMAISLLWSIALVAILPGRRLVWWSGAAAGAVIAVIDLMVIAPAMFPEIASLGFWPQLADHLAWGACVGAVLARTRRRDQPAQIG